MQLPFTLFVCHLDRMQSEFELDILLIFNFIVSLLTLSYIRLTTYISGFLSNVKI